MPQPNDLGSWRKVTGIGHVVSIVCQIEPNHRDTDQGSRHDRRPWSFASEREGSSLRAWCSLQEHW
jgi:hypothetical protein